MPGKTFALPAVASPLYGWPLPGRDVGATRSVPTPTAVPSVLSPPVWSDWGEPVQKGVLAGDVNGDGRLEFVMMDGAGHLVVRDVNLRVLWRRRVSPSIRIGCLSEVNGDGLPEIILGSGQPPPLATVYDGQGTQLWTLEPRSGEDTLWIREFCPAVVADLDGDGMLEVVVLVHNRHRSPLFQPRGVYVYEYGTGRERWRYPVAPHASNAVVVDLDGDGQREIVLGTYAQQNSDHVINDTDDYHPFVVVLDAGGRGLWTSPPLGEYFSGVSVAATDLNQDGRLEVLASKYTAYGYHPDDEGGLFLFDHQGREIGRFDSPYSFSFPAIGDVDGDQLPEVVASSRDGKLWVFNSELRVKAEYESEGPIWLQALADLDGDGLPEALALTEKGEIVVHSFGRKEPLRHFLGGAGTKYKRRGELIVVDGPWPCHKQVLVWQRGGEEFLFLHLLRTFPTVPLQPAAPPRVVNADCLWREIALSPDRSWIAAIAAPAPEAETGDLYLLSAAEAEASALQTSAAALVLADGCAEVAWSPDGRRLAFSRWSGEQEVDVWSAPVGGAPVALTSDGCSRSPTYSPDGTRIAFCSLRGGGWGLWVMSADGSQPRCLMEAPGEISSPRWSPDGQRICFLRSLAQEEWYPYPLTFRHLFVVDVDGGAEPRDVTPDEALAAAIRDPANGFGQARLHILLERQHTTGHAAAPCWSPTSGEIVCSLALLSVERVGAESIYDTLPNLWKVHLASGTLRRLTQDERSRDEEPRWSPGGTWIAYTTSRPFDRTRRVDVGLINGLGGAAAVLESGGRPVWADEERLYFLREGALYAVALAMALPPPPALLDAGAEAPALRRASVQEQKHLHVRERQATLRRVLELLDELWGPLHQLKNDVQIRDLDGATERAALVVARIEALRREGADLPTVLPAVSNPLRGDLEGLWVALREALHEIPRRLGLIQAPAGTAEARPQAWRDFAELVGKDSPAGLLARLEACVLKDVSVESLLARAVAAVQPQADERGTRIVPPDFVSALARVPGDPGPLEEAVVEVLLNALKSVERAAQTGKLTESGRILITVEEAADLSLHLRFADNGVGLSAEQVVALNSGRRGEGLGWLDVWRTLRDYGGSARIDSPGPGQGAVVTLTFSGLGAGQ